MTTIDNQFDDQLNLTVPSYDARYILAHEIGQRTEYISNHQITLLMKCVLLGRKAPQLFDTYFETKEALNEIDSVSSHGYSALMIATMNSAGVSTVCIMRKLIEKNAKINGLSTSTYKENTLHCAIPRAATTASIDAIRLLLENGADTHAKMLFGMTPLDLAIHFLDRGSTLAVVKLIIPFSDLNKASPAFSLRPLESILHTLLGRIPNRDFDNLDKQIAILYNPPTNPMIDIAECLILAGATLNPSDPIGEYIFRIYSLIVQSLLQKQQEQLKKQQAQLTYRASFNQMVKDNEIGLEKFIRDYL